MSWHFSRALVEEFLEANSSAGEQSTPSSSNNTHGMCWSPGKTMDASSRSRSGMMYEPLTESRGEELLTWFLEVFRARTYPAPEKAPESQESAVDSGRSLPGSLAKLDRVTSSWKTAQCLLDGDLEPFSGTWPRWGTMRNGECWERLTPERRTSGIESGSFPTPTVNGNYNRNGLSPSSGDGLATYVRMWPSQTAQSNDKTPRLTDAMLAWEGKSRPKTGAKVQARLQDAAAYWPTPTKSCSKGSGPTMIRKNGKRRGDRLDYATERMADGTPIGGKLNPTWVEWLMGWPLGWTDCAASATDKFRRWLDSHGIHSSPHPDKPQTGE